MSDEARRAGRRPSSTRESATGSASVGAQKPATTRESEVVAGGMLGRAPKYPKLGNDGDTARQATAGLGEPHDVETRRQPTQRDRLPSGPTAYMMVHHGAAGDVEHHHVRGIRGRQAELQ